MFWDDLRKVLAGTVIYRLDGLIGRRLAPLLYVTGLGATAIWAIGHLVSGFALSFAQGLWAIVEILVFGSLAVVVLRIACELLLVFFDAHENTVIAVDRTRRVSTLLDDVSDAIHELAQDDDIMPATEPAPFLPSDDDPDAPIARRAASRPRRRPAAPKA